MNDLILELKELIISCLDLEDISPGDIDSAAPLFGSGLGLDSIDALELGLAIHKKYDIRLDSHSDEARKVFQSVASLAEYIRAKR